MNAPAPSPGAVTVYIPCHNAEKFLAGCVNALLGQALKPAEILVVNDGSTDRTREVAAGLPVRLIDLEGHPGLAAARNAAVSEARCSLVASLDVDCLARRVFRRLYDEADYQRVGFIGGKWAANSAPFTTGAWRPGMRHWYCNGALPPPH